MAHRITRDDLEDAVSQAAGRRPGEGRRQEADADDGRRRRGRGARRPLLPARQAQRQEADHARRDPQGLTGGTALFPGHCSCRRRPTSGGRRCTRPAGRRPCVAADRRGGVGAAPHPPHARQAPDLVASEVMRTGDVIRLEVLAPRSRRGAQARWRPPFAYGDKVLLLDTKQRRYLVTLARAASSTATPASLPHSDLVAAQGSWAMSTKGAQYTALRPTLEDFVRRDARGAQVIYPKDLAPICMLADIGPGRPRVRERRRLRRAVDDDAALGRRRSSATSCARTSPTGPGPTCAASSARRCSTRYDGRAARQLRGHRRPTAVRPRRARPARAVAGRAPRRGRRSRPAGSWSPTRRRSSQAAQCSRGAGRRRRGAARARWRCCTALAHRGPGRAARPPDGGPHRVPHRVPPRRRLDSRLSGPRTRTKAPRRAPPVDERCEIRAR